MTKTALARVRDRLSEYNSTTGHIGIHLMDMFKMIEEELPYEREQMESCYGDGIKSGLITAGTPDKTGEPFTDYFTQNYTQDGE